MNITAGQPLDPLALDQLLEYRARLLQRLESQPGEFALVIAAIPAEQRRQRRDAQGRTPHLIAAHVRDLEARAFLPRVQRILAEDRPVLTPFSHHDWSAADYDPGESMDAILAEWSRARGELLALARPLDSAGWSRAGFHPPSGNRTLQWWAERAYAHASEHLSALRAAA